MSYLPFISAKKVELKWGCWEYHSCRAIESIFRFFHSYQQGWLSFARHIPELWVVVKLWKRSMKIIAPLHAASKSWSSAADRLYWKSNEDRNVGSHILWTTFTDCVYINVSSFQPRARPMLWSRPWCRLAVATATLAGCWRNWRRSGGRWRRGSPSRPGRRRNSGNRKYSVSVFSKERAEPADQDGGEVGWRQDSIFLHPAFDMFLSLLFSFLLGEMQRSLAEELRREQFLRKYEQGKKDIINNALSE